MQKICKIGTYDNPDKIKKFWVFKIRDKKLNLKKIVDNRMSDVTEYVELTTLSCPQLVSQ